MLLALRRLCAGCCYGISIVLAFSCGRTDKCGRAFFFSETEGKKSTCSKMSGYLTLSADAGRMSLLKVYSTAVTCNGFKASSRYLIT